MGQVVDVINKDVLDIVIINVLIVDVVVGIFKVDVGIKVCLISEFNILKCLN